MQNRNWGWRLVALALAICLVTTGSAMAAKKKAKKGGKKGGKVSEMEVVQSLERMVGLGRAIVTDNQDNINDKEKGDKGFNAESFSTELTKRMKDEDKIDLSSLGGKSDAASKAMANLLEAMKKVITDAQPVVNQKGMGFKGFIPAVFARRALEEFNQKSDIKGKVTAKVYRNAKNAPDDWEKAQLDKFMKADWKHGEPIHETVVSDSGDKELRYIKPEYYAGKCLKCHGEPKGERDITGGLKEGFKEGDAGAALSFRVPLKK